MKICYLLVALLLFICRPAAHAQNHVPNPSFEDHTGCPTGPIQMYYCNQWTPAAGTPDYYNVCGSGDAHVPNNGMSASGYVGYQVPAQGNAYIGLMPYNPSHFEYVTVPITPLIPGQTYEVSMSVNLANWSTIATDNIGVFFYDKGYQSVPWTINNLFMEMLPQVHYRSFGIIKDTVHWVRLTKQFTPDSAYSHMMIGGFNDSTGSYSMDTVGALTIGYGFAYYLIDSVVVHQGFPASTGSLQTIQSLSLYPNPCNGRFILNGSAQTDDILQLTVLNMTGQVVYSRIAKPSKGILQEEIQLDGIAKGLYLLRVTDNSGNVRVLKLTVQ